MSSHRFGRQSFEEAGALLCAETVVVNNILARQRESELPTAPGALIELARTVATHGDDDDRTALRALGERPGTNPAVVEAVVEILAPEEPEEPVGGAPAEELQRTMTAEQLDAVMQAARDRIRPRVQSVLRRPPDLADVTMTMVISGEGELDEFAVKPQDDVLGSCPTLSLAESTFPTSDLERHRVPYTIRIEH